MARYRSTSGMGNCFLFGLTGCGGLLALGIGVVILIAVMASRDAKQRADALAEADKLFKAGKVADAVAKYNEAGYSAVPAERRAEVVKRVVDWEAGLGNRTEARKWVEKGLDDNVSLAFDTAAGKAALAEVQGEREAKLAQRRAEDEARQKERQAAKDEHAKANGDKERIKANRRKPREEFRAMLLDKTADQVIALIGRPDRTSDDDDGIVWYYYNAGLDTNSGKLSFATIRANSSGIVNRVDFD
jgi:hypothetical protein